MSKLEEKLVVQAERLARTSQLGVQNDKLKQQLQAHRKDAHDVMQVIRQASTVSAHSPLTKTSRWVGQNRLVCMLQRAEFAHGRGI